MAAFLRICKPKPRRRGRGRVQHLQIERPEVVRFLDSVFCELDSFLPLFPLSAGVFRARWDKLLSFLWVPKRCRRPTPASIRGGGAMQAYRPGKSLQSILWRMLKKHAFRKAESRVNKYLPLTSMTAWVCLQGTSNIYRHGDIWIVLGYYWYMI